MVSTDDVGAHLHTWRREQVTLVEAVELSQLVPAVVLLSSPWSFEIARVVESGFQGPAGPIDVAAVYEARCFNQQAELRWYQRGGGVGSAVVLSEDPQVGQGLGGEPGSLAVDVLGEHRYLLWGVSREPSVGGWARLYEGRVGSIHVPVDVSVAEARVGLRAIEYVGHDAHGNAYVTEERLLGLAQEG